LETIQEITVMPRQITSPIFSAEVEPSFRPQKCGS